MLKLVVIVGDDASFAKRVQELCGEETLMTFSNTIDKSEATAKLLNDAGRKAVSVSGRTADRDAVVKRFEAREINTLSVCGMLVEGFDSTVDHVAFMDLIGSVIRLLQGVGRVRKYLERMIEAGFVFFHLNAVEENGECVIANVDMKGLTGMMGHLRTCGSDLRDSIDNQSFQLEGLQNASQVITDGVRSMLRKASGVIDFSPYLEKLIGFYDEHERLPTQSVEAEKPLYSFMNSCALGKSNKRERKILEKHAFFKEYLQAREEKNNRAYSQTLSDILKVAADKLNSKQRKYLTCEVYNAGNGNSKKASHLQDYNYLKENHKAYFDIVNSREDEKNVKCALDKAMKDASKATRDEKNPVFPDDMSDTVVLLFEYIKTNKKMPSQGEEKKFGELTWKIGNYAKNVKQAKRPSSIKDKTDLRPLLLPLGLEGLLEPKPLKKRKATASTADEPEAKKTSV